MIMTKVPIYARNIQGYRVKLSLVDVDPFKVELDPTNPRIGFSMKQLDHADRKEEAAELLLTSQEDTEALKRSIILSDGVQEPIYVRANGTVAEGNRRVVAVRAAREEHPDDPRFKTIPAWVIPKGTPEHVIKDLLNEIHLGAVRGWAPYEKALQMRALMDGGLIEDEVAERYRMSAREVRQQLAAVELMERLYFPITNDPSDPEHRTKFSYFFEFCRNGRIQGHCADMPELPERFSRWVRDGRIDTGARVRRLPKILDSEEATRLLEVAGFDAADECLARKNPQDQELYATLERTRARLAAMTVPELMELSQSDDRRAILRELQQELGRILKTASRVRSAN